MFYNDFNTDTYQDKTSDGGYGAWDLASESNPMVYGSQNTAEERADIPAGQDHCSLKEAERKNHGQHGAQDDVLDDCARGDAYGKAIHGECQS